MMNSEVLEGKDLGFLQSLYGYLSAFLTPRRRSLFEQVAQSRTQYLSLLVEDVHQEHNASALVRTCDCFGIQQMHILEKGNEGKVSSGMAKGAEKWVDVFQHKATKREPRVLLQAAKKAGYQIAATTPHGQAHTPQDLPLDRPTLVLFGQEGPGLSQELFNEADCHLNLAMYGFTESFNVSVSAALVLQVLVHRLRQEGQDWALSEAAYWQLLTRWALKMITNEQVYLREFLNQHPQYDFDIDTLSRSLKAQCIF